jgi:tRNA-guanine transglycosylase
MYELSPERAIEIQRLLGADISMQLDECLRLPATREEIARAMQLSLRWAERSKRAFEGAKPGYALFGIVQGGDDPALRVESARALVGMDFQGYAIGGLAVGEPQPVMLSMIDIVAPELPADRPRYLMGVGTPDDLMEAVWRGIDMFDCVMPTRNGRHGLAFTRFGPVNLKNARHADDPRPLDEQSADPATRTYSRAYLHHLVKANETLGAMLLSAVNLAYYQSLMCGARGDAGAGRRLYACGILERHRDQRQFVQEPALRSGEGLRAGLGDGLFRPDLRHQRRRPLQDARRLHQGRQRKAWRAQYRHHRRGLDPESRRRAAQDDGRHQCGDRAVQDLR